MKKILIILSVMLLAGCEEWAPMGTGGIAEIANPRAAELPIKNPSYQMVAKALRNEGARLNQLKREGVKYCYPGQYEELQLQYNRVQRELVAGLFIDAHTDVRELHMQITYLQTVSRKNPYRQSCSHRGRRA